MVCYKRNEIKYARRLHFNNSFKSFQIIGTLWTTDPYGQPGCGYKKNACVIQQMQHMYCSFDR